MRKIYRRLSRRDYLRWLMLGGAGTVLAACRGQETPVGPSSLPPQKTAEVRVPPTRPTQTETLPTVHATQSPTSGQREETAAEPQLTTAPKTGQAYLAVARGEDPAAITEAAILALGGIERFVKQGYDVIIKPNICTDYYPFEYGATTNPLVVAALVKLALGAGAKRVRVMDSPFGGTAESAYAKSGIAEAVKSAGGEMEVMNFNKFKKTPIPQGKSIKQWAVYQDVLSCDLMIDVAIAKHHSLARITAAEKNLLGVVTQRSSIHADMEQRLPDLLSLIKPGLTVVDAVRTLMRNGPTGGNLDDVKLNNTVIASHDTVAADAFAATLFDLTGDKIPYIRKAADMGLGTLDLSSIKVEELTV